MTRLLMIALLAVSVSSCALTNRLQLGGDGGGPGRKTVSAKEEPLTLVALDGTECTVTSAKFNRTKIGDMVWCAWRSRGGARPPGGVGGPIPIGGGELIPSLPAARE